MARRAIGVLSQTEAEAPAGSCRRVRVRGPIASHLFQTYGYSAHCSRHFSADLRAAKLEDHTIGILQLDASSPSRQGTAGSDRAVTAFNRSRPSQIQGPSGEPGCRGSDREADAHARYGEWIAFASEGQHALAAADPDDEPAFREYDRDPAGFGPRWRAEASHAHEQGNQSDAYAKFFHDFFPLKGRNAAPRLRTAASSTSNQQGHQSRRSTERRRRGAVAASRQSPHPIENAFVLTTFPDARHGDHTVPPAA